MNYLLIPVIINQVSASGEVNEIPSLLFTDTLDEVKAKKLSAYHIFHLHENSPETLPSPSSVRLGRSNKVKVNQNTTITFGKVTAIGVKEKQIIGRLGLFGYNKKLVPRSKPLLLC